MKLNNKSVRVIRTALGMERSELAEKVGISAPMVSLIENGNRKLSVMVEKRMLEVFGISDELLFRLTDVLHAIEKDRQGC